ncbi:cupin domain-containing protein [Rhodococcus sp. JVH1]|uniref:cupin domain-containing protein n=1 Tax=Rhodococcus sp. JVH1 TaxID=745408 RepID=UPI0002721333|nr:cupin domain-containing protein [Rhodococcus sp. JVH1]EJI95721.1 gentisate 1,2-dioxygenase domain protein [Rhodococcus sp. JVH1]
MLELTGTGHAQLRFRDPTRNRDVMPTLRCEMLRLLAGVSTPADRQTGSRVCAVLRGSGRVDIGEKTFTLSAGDVFVVPSWATHRLTADHDLDIFTTSDAPVLEALSLYRSEQVQSS